MNKNRRYAATTKMGLAIATAASVFVGSMSYAAEIPSETEVPGINNIKQGDNGALAGVLSATASIHDNLAGNNVPGSLAGVFAATSKIHTGIAGHPVVVMQESFGSRAAEETAPVVYFNDTQVNISDILFSNTDGYLNIRTSPSKESEIAGRLRANDMAIVTGESDGWYSVQSGEVTGFVHGELSLVGEAALPRYYDITKTTVKNLVKSLNIRAEASTEADIIKTIKSGVILPLAQDIDIEDNWVPVLIGETIGYVAGEFVEIKTGVPGTAMTPAQIEEARIAAEKAAAERAARIAELQTSVRPDPIQNSAIAANVDEETLLAALLECEAGSSYDGMLAVGGVVVNRLHAGYSDSIYGVIYQRGQFTPASSGKLAKVLSRGPSSTALQAARDALSGKDITGGCKSFRAAKSGHAGLNIGGNVFF